MDSYQDRDVQSSVKFKCQLNFNGRLNFLEMYINSGLCNPVQMFVFWGCRGRDCMVD